MGGGRANDRTDKELKYMSTSISKSMYVCMYVCMYVGPPNLPLMLV